MVRLGKIQPPFPDPPLQHSEPISKRQEIKDEYFDINQLPSLTPYQVVFFDETHSVCEISNTTKAQGQDVVYRFLRDENGKLDPNGSYHDCDPLELKVKYEKEVRLMLGVAMVKYPSGEVEGKRVKEFDYTEQTIVTEKEWIRSLNES